MHPNNQMIFSRRRQGILPWISLGAIAVIGLALAWPAVGSAGAAGQVWEDAPADASQLLPNGYSPLPSLKGLIKKLNPAVVNIYSTQVFKPRATHRGRMQGFHGPAFEDFFGGRGRELKRDSLGSGFIISEDGYVITNHHVVAKATEIKVRLADEETLDAKLIGSDQKTDVALLKVDTKKKLPFVRLGDSDQLEVGDWAIAIGNPFGLGQTVTAGIISGMHRQIGQGPYDAFLQTDAAINPGNSGGPLFDSAGRVVGINTAIVAGGSGVGFAVPINLAKGLLPQLASKGKVSRGWLGVGIQDLSPDLAERFGVKTEAGVLISQVFQHSPADEAGMQAGDIILSIQGKPMRESRQLTNLIATLPPGKAIRLQVKRRDKNLKLRVKLGERERGEAAAFGGLAEAPTETPGVELGLTLSPLNQDRARRLGLDPGTRGLVIDEFTRSGPTAGVLKKGDVILEVNRTRVTNLKEFNRALGKDRKSSLLLRIQRGNKQIYAVIRP